MRQFDGNTYRGLKTAFRRLVNAFGKMEVAASETRVNQVSLSNYCSLNAEQEKCHAPLDVTIDLMKASGDMRLLEHLASIFGKKLVDECQGTASAEPILKSMKAVQEMSEASADLAASAADGNIDQEEAKRGLQKLADAEQAIANCRETLTAIITR